MIAMGPLYNSDARGMSFKRTVFQDIGAADYTKDYLNACHNVGLCDVGTGECSGALPNGVRCSTARLALSIASKCSEIQSEVQGKIYEMCYGGLIAAGKATDFVSAQSYVQAKLNDPTSKYYDQHNGDKYSSASSLSSMKRYPKCST